MRWIALGVCLTMAVAGTARAAEPVVSAELIRLHEDLHLSASQEAAWRDYTLAIAPDPQTVARRKATSELLPMVPTPRRIALIEASMSQDAVDFRKQAAAVNLFYDRLTPTQQRVFDQDTLPGPETRRSGG